MKQIIKKINWTKVMAFVFAFMIVAAPMVASAQLSRNFDCDPRSGLNCEDLSINGLIRKVINWMLGIAFGIAVLFLIIGGFWYITSAGNEETAEKGKNTAVNALIGIVIIVLSWVIVNVVSRLVSQGGDVGR